MEKQRKIKILSILILLFVVTVMTIGFAAFSAVLTISSSATVTPAASEFKIKMYGFTSENIDDNIYYETNFTDENFARVYSSVSLSGGTLATDNYAQIDNSNFTLSNIFAEVNNPLDYATYVVKIANEGSYSAYIDTAQIETSPLNCTPAEETTVELVEQACPYLYRNSHMISAESIDAASKLSNGDITEEEFDELPENDCFAQKTICELKTDTYAYLFVGAGYIQTSSGDVDVTPRADGPFTAYFPDIKL